MEQSKLFLQSIPVDFEVGGYIESNSEENKKYFVYKKDTEWHCNCVAGLMKQECRHIKRMLEKVHEDDKCFYCGTSSWSAGGLEKHHVDRRSVHPELKFDAQNIMLLCNKCHKRATDDYKFEQNLKRLWEIRKT